MVNIGVTINKLLIKKSKTIAIAESCTGGLLSNIITNTPGSSKYFLFGIVVYSNKAKTSLLKIPASHIKRYGAVSEKIALLMAKNVRILVSSDYGIGITGIAGPSGEIQKKPVGTVFISLATKKKEFIKKFNFQGSRLEIKRKTALKALLMLKRLLLSD